MKDSLARHFRTIVEAVLELDGHVLSHEEHDQLKTFLVSISQPHNVNYCASHSPQFSATVLCSATAHKEEFRHSLCDALLGAVPWEAAWHVEHHLPIIRVSYCMRTTSRHSVSPCHVSEVTTYLACTPIIDFTMGCGT
jgi:hypothetical protein